MPMRIIWELIFCFSKVPAQMFLVDIIMPLIAFFIIIVNKRM